MYASAKARGPACMCANRGSQTASAQQRADLTRWRRVLGIAVDEDDELPRRSRRLGPSAADPSSPEPPGRTRTSNPSTGTSATNSSTWSRSTACSRPNSYSKTGGTNTTTTTTRPNHSATKPQQRTPTNGMLTTTTDPHNKRTKKRVRSWRSSGVGSWPSLPRLPAARASRARSASRPPADLRRVQFGCNPSQHAPL
jgi:hypothetical protein